MERKSFILYIDTLNVLDELTDEQAGILFKTIANTHRKKEIPDLDFGIKMAFLPFKNQFDRDNKKYVSICERNKKNGEKGGRPKKGNPNNPVGLLKTQRNPKKPKKADSESESENDIDNKKDNKNKINGFDFGFIKNFELNGETEKFTTLFITYVNYRKEIKKPYKAQISIETAFDLLLKKSKKNYKTAKKIVDETIGNGWQGLFDIKESEKKAPINGIKKGIVTPESEAEIYSDENMKW